MSDNDEVVDIRQDCWEAAKADRRSRPTEKPIAHGMTRKPETAAIVPTVPRIFAPTHTAIPTMFGPGMNWQRLTMSANPYR